MSYSVPTFAQNVETLCVSQDIEITSVEIKLCAVILTVSYNVRSFVSEKTKKICTSVDCAVVVSVWPQSTPRFARHVKAP